MAGRRHTSLHYSHFDCSTRRFPLLGAIPRTQTTHLRARRILERDQPSSQRDLFQGSSYDSFAATCDLARPALRAVLLVVFLAWASFNVMSYLSTLVFQEVQHVSATKDVDLLLPMIAAGITLNVVAGYVVGKLAAVWLIVFGATSGAAACLILSVGSTKLRRTTKPCFG